MGFLLKIAVFGVLAYMAWTTACRWLGLSNPLARAPSSRREAPSSQREAPSERRPVVEDTRLCPICATYISASAGRCDRSGCPQG